MVRDLALEPDYVYVMGILNITPDSFFDGGQHTTPDAAIEHAMDLVEQGADILDLGGESTRPGAKPVSAQEEADRILPVLEGIRRESDILISIDTTKASVARDALASGAEIINDISALRFDPEMASTIANARGWVILMHMLGVPETMQQAPKYEKVVPEVCAFLKARAEAAEAAGISREHIIVDPGIGFGKTLEHNLALLRSLDEVVSIGMPVLVGASRKSFLGAIGDVPVEGRLAGTIAAHTAAVLRGAQMIRVHDVEEGRRAADVASRLRT